MKKCSVVVVGGLSLATSLRCDTDAVISIRNVWKCKIVTLTAKSNPGLYIYVSDIPNATYIESYSFTILSGAISALSRSLTYLANANGIALIGSVSDFPPSSEVLQVGGGGTSISTGSIAALTAVRDIRLYSLAWTLSDVDTVISSAWGARAAYTYSSISLQIGGTNAAPSGNKVAPVEGSDWHEDTPGHWVPLTANAMVYDLLNDVNSEGFNKWFSITTS